MCKTLSFGLMFLFNIKILRFVDHWGQKILSNIPCITQNGERQTFLPLKMTLLPGANARWKTFILSIWAMLTLWPEKQGKLLGQADPFQQGDYAALLEVLEFHWPSLVVFHASASICWMLTSSRRSKEHSSGRLVNFSGKMILLDQKHSAIVANLMIALLNRHRYAGFTSSRRSRGNSSGKLTDFSKKTRLLYIESNGILLLLFW